MKKIHGAGVVRESLPDLLYDESRCEGGTPETVCYPETADDLREIITEARSRHQTITFIGAQTGTTGGAVPIEGCCAIAFSAMKRIHAVQKEPGMQPVLFCDPGVTLAEVERFLAAPGDWHDPVKGAGLLEAGKWSYMPDPTEMTAQLGGTVATNASGARSFRYGSTRDHIASLDVLLSNGASATLERLIPGGLWDRTITTDDGAVIIVPELPYRSLSIKNAAGYYNTPEMSAVDLFIGSEGTLGAISRIGIFLQRRQEIVAGLSFFPSTDAAFDFADFLRVLPEVAAIEFFDDGSLMLIDRYRDRLSEPLPPFTESARAAIYWEYTETGDNPFEDVMEVWEKELISCGSSFEETWSGFDENERTRLRHFRHALPEMINSIIAQNKQRCPTIRKVGTDSALPAALFRQAFLESITMLRECAIPFAVFGHLGNYHLHVNLLPATAGELDRSLELYGKLMAVAIEGGGTVSAEHGIGKIKKEYLARMYGPGGIAGMQRVKAALDPDGLFNPGNLF